MHQAQQTLYWDDNTSAYLHGCLQRKLIHVLSITLSGQINLLIALHAVGIVQCQKNQY